MTGARVFFYVQHLLGIGHLRRAATIARALTGAGLDVTVVSGGGGIPGLDLGGAAFVQLSATRAADLYFKKLLDEDGEPIDDAWRARRSAAVLAAFETCDPHVCIFELFPFGRRQMRFELLPVLEAAGARASRPVIVSSVRDILVAQNKPERNDEMLGFVERYFDHVLVHGDPEFVGFERTFPHAARIAGKIQYTGYVVDRSGKDAVSGAGTGEVIVSTGGGAVGLDLLRMAMAARPMTALAKHTWRVLVGVNVADSDYAQIAGLATLGIVVERARSDFPALAANCALSISQGGYNTLMELLEGGARCVIVPYAGGVETEQTLRVREIAKRTSIQVLDEATLTPEAIANAAAAAMAGPPPDNREIKTRGAEESARLVGEWADALPW